MRSALLCFVTLLVGCSDCDAGKPDQCLVEKIVWEEALHVREVAPQLLWTIDRCADNPYDTCEFGSLDVPTWTMRLWWSGSYAKSAYVHEAVHAALWVRFGDVDDRHVRFPEYWLLVRPIQVRLENDGL